MAETATLQCDKAYRYAGKRDTLHGWQWRIAAVWQWHVCHDREKVDTDRH
ncbi:MAG: hypothetical protein NC308_02095 [Clostridium sp.]|nr:hypothetical protein [Bacteroides sp.]MCM1197655.1 hypothetical protein [Clostridium sp.]